ncbi:MAG TPA: DUF3221 domain-containing protein [Thermoleophilia bacterium]|nr:DUF3221 domain-containing protein [Thermoleophilia bacterium]
MRHTGRALAALAVLAVLWVPVVVGCGGPAGGGTASTPSPTPPADGLADITGVVRELARPGSQDGGWPVLLVVADPGSDSSVDRASVRVTARTVVWTPAGEGRYELSAADLAVGQRVAVRFTGPVAESYPVQATAGDIEILTPL